MQYKDAGPDKIHQKITWPFMLPESPYLGTMRHDQPFFASLLMTAVQARTASVAVQTRPNTRDAAVQTEVDLSAYLINDYAFKASKQDA